MLLVVGTGQRQKKIFLDKRQVKTRETMVSAYSTRAVRRLGHDAILKCSSWCPKENQPLLIILLHKKAFIA